MRNVENQTYTSSTLVLDWYFRPQLLSDNKILLTVLWCVLSYSFIVVFKLKSLAKHADDYDGMGEAEQFMFQVTLIKRNITFRYIYRLINKN